jgi:hypothetical protein
VSHFHDSAVAAVSAATAIIETVLTDDDIRDSLVGIPHYIHSMIAFACVFLLKIAAQYSGQYIEDSVVTDLTTRVVQQFHTTPVGKWHLVHLMAEGLDKMLVKKTVPPITASHNTAPPDAVTATISHEPQINNNLHPATMGDILLGDTFEDMFNFGTSSFLNFDTGTIDLDFTGFGF